MERHLRIIQQLTRVLDTEFGFGKFKFGLDPLIGLIPGAGDTVSLLLSVYTIWVASQLPIPRQVIRQMMSNVAIDWAIGLVPIAGDVADFLFRANKRNLDLLHRHLPSDFKKSSSIQSL